MKIGCSFSSGKDSVLSLKKAIDASYEVMVLMTTANKDRSWFHDVDKRILKQLSFSLNIPLEIVVCGLNQSYADDFEAALCRFKEEYQIEGFIFGDIDLEAHRQWCEERCEKVGIQAIFPLWNVPRIDVVREFVDLGFIAYVKKIKKNLLNPSLLGKQLTQAMVDEFVKQGIDPAGESGEYHTLVVDGPIFKHKIAIVFGEVNEYENSYSIEVMNKTKNLAILGCASNVGKTTIVAGLCRLFSKDSMNVAPFKAQNISLNSGVSIESLEMGRGQILQAKACGINPSIMMNPILLKPQDGKMQIIKKGKSSNDTSDFLDVAVDAYKSLSMKHDLILLEGSGSCAELNRKGQDIANFPIINKIKAPVILVANIEQCGVFASVYGTLMLLSEEERNAVKGIIINKFHGDPTYFKEGKQILEDLCGIKVLGVVPMHNLNLDEEDQNPQFNQKGELKIGIIQLQHASNLTDFQCLNDYSHLGIELIHHPKQVANCHCIMIPGSKSTLSDLALLKENGLADAIIEYAVQGGYVLGICGGLQMLGSTISDPHKIESEEERVDGLKLLPLDTFFNQEKVTRNSTIQANYTSELFDKQQLFTGYEIHHGQSKCCEDECVFLAESDNVLGVYKNRVLATYLHGFLDNEEFTTSYLNKIAQSYHLPIEVRKKDSSDALDALANHIKKFVDIEEIKVIINEFE